MYAAGSYGSYKDCWFYHVYSPIDLFYSFVDINIIFFFLNYLAVLYISKVITSSVADSFWTSKTRF